MKSPPSTRFFLSFAPFRRPFRDSPPPFNDDKEPVAPISIDSPFPPLSRLCAHLMGEGHAPIDHRRRPKVIS